MQANIKHEEIKGFMMAMTMPYKVRNPREYESLKPGDLITSRLIIESNDAYLVDVKKVGEAPLESATGLGCRIVRIRAAQGGRARSGREVRESGWPARGHGLVQGLGAGDHVHLHAVPDADVLSADGSALRDGPGRR